MHRFLQYRIFFYSLMLSLIMGAWIPSVFAAEDGQADDVDVRLVIDVSGSMKRNDPKNLRQPAVELLVELLPEKSKSGVWTFGKWVNMLVPHKEVSNQWRASARSASQKINSVGLYTNIGEALEKAAYDIEYADPANKKNIILLTDGVVDIAKSPQENKDEWRRIVDDIIPKLKAAGYVVHTIALSDNADRDLMNKLSVSTDGVAEVAYSAEDLMKFFLKAFDAAAPAEQVALTDNQFVIDSSVEEFTALIFRKKAKENIALLAPDQQLWDANTRNNELRWHGTERYDLITVKQPLEGEWGIRGEMADGSRITVVSNLNLRIKPLPNNVLKGAIIDVSALLQEDGKTIANPDFLSLMDVKVMLSGGSDIDSLQQLYSAAMPQKARGLGHYIATLPALDKEGVYRVQLEVDGKTFTRAYSHHITLREAFSADLREEFVDESARYVLTVNAIETNVNYEKTRVVATVTTPSKRKLIRPLNLSELDSWRATITPEEEGQYTVDVQVKGELNDGIEFSYDLSTLGIVFSSEGGFVEEVPPFVESRAEPSPEPVAEPKSEPEVQDEEVLSSEFSLPTWAIYAAVGVGNLLLFALGYFAYKKFISDDKDDIIDEIDREVAEKEEVEVTESPAEDPAEEDEEEPPMEDLDPNDISSEEPKQKEEIEILDAPPEAEVLEPEPEAEDEVAMDAMMELTESMDDEEPTEMEDIDDLDAMSMAPELSDEEENKVEEEEDMVEAMLKAQGLDLAEEELDDAISSLIDDLDDDDD